MAIKTDTLGAWIQTRNTLVQNLVTTMEFRAPLPNSGDPGSDFAKANAQIDRLTNQILELALVGLKQVDDAIASGTLVQDIAALSKEAKKEADRIKRATRTIQDIVKAIDMVTGVVTKILGLPFL